MELRTADRNQPRAIAARPGAEEGARSSGVGLWPVNRGVRDR